MITTGHDLKPLNLINIYLYFVICSSRFHCRAHPLFMIYIYIYIYIYISTHCHFREKKLSNKVILLFYFQRTSWWGASKSHCFILYLKPKTNSSSSFSIMRHLLPNQVSVFCKILFHHHTLHFHIGRENDQQVLSYKSLTLQVLTLGPNLSGASVLDDIASQRINELRQLWRTFSFSNFIEIHCQLLLLNSMA